MFEGKEGVAWLQQNATNSLITADRAIGLGQLILEKGLLCHEHQEKCFGNNRFLYYCSSEPSRKRVWKAPSEW